MKKKFCVKKINASILFLFAATFLNAETFRVSKVKTVNLTNDFTTEKSTSVGINEALAIFLPEDKTFLQGLEIKMDIPSAIASWPDCVACSIYNDISPKPSESKIDYSGTRFFVSTLPGRLSWILQIPLTKNNTIKSKKVYQKYQICDIMCSKQMKRSTRMKNSEKVYVNKASMICYCMMNIVLAGAYILEFVKKI